MSSILEVNVCRTIELRNEHELQLGDSRTSAEQMALSRTSKKLSEVQAEAKSLTRSNQQLNAQLKNSQADVQHLEAQLATEQRRRAAVEQDARAVKQSYSPSSPSLRELEETLKECRRQLKLKTEESHRLQAELRESSALQLKATHVISDIQAQLGPSPSGLSMTPTKFSPEQRLQASPMSVDKSFPSILTKDGRLDISNARKIINYDSAKTYDLDGCDF